MDGPLALRQRQGQTQIPFGNDKQERQQQRQRQRQKQIPFGNDKQKGRYKGKGGTQSYAKVSQSYAKRG